MENFLIVAQQVAVLFVLMGVGAACRKAKLLDDNSVGGIVNMLLLVVTPCLIVDCFQRDYDPTMLGSLGLAFVIAVGAHLLVISLAYLFVRPWADATRRTLRLAAVFSNAGFVGIPLEMAIFGSTGAFYGIVYVAVFNLFIWSWGYCMMGGRPRPVSMVFNPGTVGLALGLPLFFFSVRLPFVLHEPIHWMAGLNTPLAMISIGYYLAGAKILAALRVKQVWLTAFIRLVAYPLIVLTALYPFRHAVDRTMALAMITACSAPVAAMVSVFAVKFNRDVDASVSLVSGTALLSMITMPVVIALAMGVFR